MVKRVIIEKRKKRKKRIISKNEEDIIFDPKYKPDEFLKFRMWLALPHIFRKKDNRILDALAIQDDEAKEFLAIDTMTKFAEKYNLDKDTLTRWKKEVREKDYLFEDIKAWVKSVMNNVMGSVYKQVLIDGDAARAKFLATFVGQYSEKNENINPANDLVNQKLVDFLDRFKLRPKK